MGDINAKTVREIALEFPISTRIFEEYRIDYCCGGRKPLEQACDEAGVSMELVAERLEELRANTNEVTPEDFDSYSLEDLVDYVLDTHHTFTRREIANLTPLMAKVADRHGGNHPSLLILKSLVFELFGDLDSHMRKEEVILFPFVKEMATQNDLHTSVPPPFGSVRGPISVMAYEHDRAGDLLRKMRNVTVNYDLPADACPSFTALFTRLEELEKDLHQHIHLENNILFPKALELEQKMYPVAVG